MRAKQMVWGLAALLTAVSAQAETQVGVSVSVNQPGFYGRVDIGSGPPPAVIFPQPVIIQPAPVPYRRPVYLRVPPGHEKNWGKHCHKYGACAQPVYFVRAEAASPQRDRRDSRGDAHPGGKHGDRGEGRGEGKGHGRKHD